MQKNARKTAKNEDQTTMLTGIQLTMPLPELLREELYGVVTRLGLLAVENMLRQDVEALCGPRYSRGGGGSSQPKWNDGREPRARRAAGRGAPSTGP